MTITSAQYTENNENIKATIDGAECFVPIDAGNLHYQAIQEWVAEGNTIEEAD